VARDAAPGAVGADPIVQRMRDSAVAGPVEATPPAGLDPGGDPPAERASGFAARAYWLWPALLTLALAGWGLGTPALWADELATWGAVRLDWGPLVRLAGHVDAVVLPYFAVEKLWTSVAGTSPAALRLPSVLAMAGAAALVAVLGRRVSGRRVGVLAGLTFAVVPATSRFAQEARPYAFVVLFAVLATLLLVRFLDRPGPATGLPYALAVAGLGAFHLIALLLLVAHAVVARRRLAGWAAWAGAGVVPVLPLAWYGTRQSGQVSWIPPAHLHTILAAPDSIFVAGEVGGALIVLGVLAFSRRRPAPMLAAWALVPVVVLAAVAQFTPLFWPRYLLYTMPAWVLLAALTLARLSWVRAAGVLVAIVLVGLPTQTAIRTADGHSQGTSQAGGIIAANYRPGDAIVYSQLETAPWVARDVVSRYVPGGRRPTDVFAVTGQRVDGHLAAAECPDLTACLDRAVPERIWVLRPHTVTDPLSGLGPAKESLLRAGYRLSALWLPKDLTLALYVRQ
jgi:mannosyltransferase